MKKYEIYEESRENIEKMQTFCSNEKCSKVDVCIVDAIVEERKKAFGVLKKKMLDSAHTSSKTHLRLHTRN